MKAVLVYLADFGLMRVKLYFATHEPKINSNEGMLP